MYAIWRACERFGVKPPGVKSRWEDMTAEEQKLLIAYDQVASHDELQVQSQLAGAKF